MLPTLSGREICSVFLQSMWCTSDTFRPALRTTAKLYLKIQLYREYRFSREMSFLKRVCFRKCIQRLGTMEAIYITYPGQWSIIIIERQWNLNSIYYLKIRRKLSQNTAACATGQREWQYLSEKGHSGKHKI